MKSKKDAYATVDSRGRVILPRSVRDRLGLKPGSTVALAEQAQSVTIRQPVTRLTKVYLEAANTCNLACRTCMRTTWDEPLGRMSEATFARVIDGLRMFSPPPDIMFGGLGEPLGHPQIIEMVRHVKTLGSRVELITNGTLLSEAVARELITAGLDVLWVSIDGARPDSYADVRLGAALPEVIAKVACFRDLRHIYHTKIGIVFVAMKRNINDLPEVMILGRKLGADRFLITNVIPYAEDMCAEVLYADALWSGSGKAPSPLAPRLQAARIDLNETTVGSLYRVLRSWRITHFAAEDVQSTFNFCPFIGSGSTALAWDGSLSPCVPLMHSCANYVHNRRRFSTKHVVGNINDRSLEDLWTDPEYHALRELVQTFDFPPCTHCGGCRLAQTNEEDCFGNGFPTCGGCLWAQGIIRCP